MKNLKLVIPVLIFLVVVACNKEYRELDIQSASKVDNEAFCLGSKTLKIAVLSDLHYMDPSLLKKDGTAFQMYLMQDPKLLAESGAILQQILRKLIS